VSSYAVDDAERLLLFDPLAVPTELEALAAGRETAIVLTAPWHERDAERLVERLGAPVYHAAGQCAVVPDGHLRDHSRAGRRAAVPDVVWLLREHKGEARPYAAGERLPFGADRLPGAQGRTTRCSGSRASGAVISGDTLVDFGQVSRSTSGGFAPA